MQTHEFSSLKGPKGEKVFEAYAEQSTPAAYRVFWYYGPSISRRLLWPRNSIAVEQTEKFGECAAAWAKYFNIDPTLMRIIAVASLFVGSLGFWIYIIMTIVVPVES